MYMSFCPARFFAFFNAGFPSSAFPIAKPANPLPFPVTTNALMDRFLPMFPVICVTVLYSNIFVSKPSKVSVKWSKRNLSFFWMRWVMFENDAKFKSFEFIFKDIHVNISRKLLQILLGCYSCENHWIEFDQFSTRTKLVNQNSKEASENSNIVNAKFSLSIPHELAKIHQQWKSVKK